MRILTLVLALALVACKTAPSGPYSPPTEVERETATAERLSREAADLISSDLAEAERLLREALTADLFHGPAHNNLGVVFLKEGKLYEAAQEFEWAKKLMPGAPDPRVNLALVWEAAGRTDDALGAYAAALEVRPEYVPAIQGMARLLVLEGRDDQRLAQWLEALSLRADDQVWRKWAREQRAALAVE
jgi:Tfp pilus assembly protein PilF